MTAIYILQNYWHEEWKHWWVRRHTSKLISNFGQRICFPTRKQVSDQLKTNKKVARRLERTAPEIYQLRCWHHNPKQKQIIHALSWAKTVQMHLNKFRMDIETKTCNHSREQHSESNTRVGIKLRRCVNTRLRAKSNWDLRVSKAPKVLSWAPVSPAFIVLRADDTIWNVTWFDSILLRSSIGFRFSFNLTSRRAINSAACCKMSWDIVRTPTGPIKLQRFSKAKPEV